MHQGVHTIHEAGQPDVFGDITLSEGAGITLTQVGNDVAIAANPAGIDHGLLAGLVDDDHPQYLLIDGSRAMTGDLDLTINYKLIFGDVRLARQSPTMLRIEDSSANLRDIYARYCYFTTGVITSANYSRIRLDAVSQSLGKIVFETKYPSAYTIIATINNSGNFEINRAGDITMLTGSILDFPTNDGILLLPDIRSAAPQAGEVRYDPATDTLEIYDGAAWNPH